MDKHNQNALSQRLERSYLEIIPAPGIEERLMALPDHAYVAITCSPVHGVDPTLDLVDRLSGHTLKLIPHIAARTVRSRAHLGEILQRLDAANIKSVFVPGGDAPEPLGPYACALDLLRGMSEAGHSIKDVGVAAHPEGHPVINESILLQALLDKQAFANYFVTQMCFDAQAIVRWLRQVRSAGVTLPAWVGLPGVADRARLAALSMRIGVGQSARLLLKQKGLLKKMLSLKPYQPDELLESLAPHLGDEALNIPGFHLFSFNDIERTERWRHEAIKQSGAGITGAVANKR